MAPKPRSSHSARSANKRAPDSITAKYGLIGTIIVATIGLIGTGITAYLGYLGIQSQIEKPIRATQTAEARAIVNVTQTAIEMNLIGYTIVYPSCNCYEYLDPYEKVLIRLRWGGATEELAERGADFIKQTLFVDREDFGEIKDYRRPAIYVKDPVIEGDPGNAWWVYWDIPIGQLYGDYEFDLTVELLAGIATGWDVLPAGLVKTFHATVRGMEFPATQAATPNP